MKQLVPILEEQLARWLPVKVSPGIPVWLLGLETKFPGLPYIVFPGNVGGPVALTEVLQKLKATA